jgi:hypothetical protein
MTMLRVLVEWLEVVLGAAWSAVAGLPDSLWGAIVGALSALLGSSLAARHDRKLRREEREMALRRDVYLRAFEAASRLREFFGTLSNTFAAAESPADLQAAVERVQGTGAVVSAVDLVGDIGTVKAFSDAQRTFRDELLAVTKEGIALLAPKDRVRALQGEIDNLQGELTNLVSALRSVSPNQRAGYEQFAVPRLQALTGQLQARNAELAEAHVELGDAKVRLILRSLEASQALEAQLAGAVVEARRELGMPVEAEDFRQLIADRSRDDTAKFGQWLAELRREALEDEQADADAPPTVRVDSDQPR